MNTRTIKLLGKSKQENTVIILGEAIFLNEIKSTKGKTINWPVRMKNIYLPKDNIRGVKQQALECIANDSQQETKSILIYSCTIIFLNKNA